MLKTNNFLSLYLIQIIIIFFSNNSIFCQGSTSEFGKNRVQYHDDFKDWWEYDTDNYTIYWYGKERNTAISAFLLSQISYSKIEELLDYKINRKIKLILYSDISDFKQSNIGIKDNTQNTLAGRMNFSNNKVVVYFDGNHSNLLKDIRKGTTKVLLNNMFQPNSLKNILKNASSEDFPDWLYLGAIEYLSTKWDIESNNNLKNSFAKMKFDLSFKKLSQNIPKLAGHSFLNFIEQEYGEKSLSDLFYFFRLSGDLNTSIYNTTSKNIIQIFKEWNSYYSNIYKAEYKKHTFTEDSSILKLNSNSNKFIYSSLNISNNEKYITYSTNNNGKKKLYLYNIEKQKSNILLKTGYINKIQPSDCIFPLTAFDDTSKKLYILYRKKNDIILKIVNLLTSEENISTLPERFKTIYSFDYWENNTLILNGNTDGFDDLYFYDIKKRQSKRITHDFFDDIQIKTSNYNNQKGIIFASNRHNLSLRIDKYDTILPTSNFDIFFLNPNEKSLINLTSTKNINELQPQISNNNIVYASDQNGISSIKELNPITNTKRTFFISNTESIKSVYATNNLLLFSANKLCTNTLYLAYKDNLKLIKNENNYLFPFKEEKQKKSIYNKSSIVIDNSLLFQTKFKDYKNNKNIKEQKTLKQDSPKRIKKFRSSNAIASRLRFSFSNLITKIDNTPLFDELTPYSSSNPDYSSPKRGLLLKTQIKDLFEDYFIETGMRISTNLKEKEYFVVLENLKNQIDWQFGFYKKTNSNYKLLRQNIIDKFAYSTNSAFIKAKYPFDIYRSFNIGTKLRFDKEVLLASDTISLNQQPKTNQRLSLNIEYIFDNTSNIRKNILNGTRASAFINIYNRFNLKLNSLSKFDLSEAYMVSLGVDIRNYTKIYRSSIIAFRLNGQTSFGSESNLYYLGGVNNWQLPKYSNLESINQNQNYAYKVLAANMRGFGYNARNGTSFLLFNTELRIPILSTIFNSTSKNNFLDDLQFISFFDTGLAWNGITPFSLKNNSINKTIIIPPVLKLKINYYSDPIIASYGFGVRTTIFGYFVKLDYAWGIENKTVLKPMIHFSTGFDF